MTTFLYKNISEQLEAKIRELPVGQKLPSERNMAEEYGVSRNVLREALRVLNEKRLIEIQPGRGAYVADKKNEKLADRLESILFENKSGLIDIVEVRESLELSIFTKAVEKANTNNIKVLEKIYQLMEENKLNVKKYNEFDSQFHIQLAKCTQNSIFPILISTLYNITDKKLFRITELYPSRINSAQREHLDIINAIKTRDVKMAKDVAKIHFNIEDILSGKINK